MTTEPCEACGDAVKIAGGIANLWTFGGDEAGGMTLELGDGTEHFLCYDCIDRLPDYPSAEDVRDLDRRDDPEA